MRARPVYDIHRIGGEDHLPLFRARVLLMPQRYSVEGEGRSKPASRRQAAANMLDMLANQTRTSSPPLSSTAPSTHHPAPPGIDHTRESVAEMEEGELSSEPEKIEPEDELFYVDREPDPELEEEAAAEVESKHDDNALENGEIDDQSHPAKETPTAENNSSKAKRELDGVTKKPEDEARLLPAIPRVPVAAPHTSTHASPQKRKRVSTEVKEEHDPIITNAVTPPRKRTKGIPRDFPMRMRIWIFSDYTEKAVDTLRELADANLFVDLSIYVYSLVDLPKYILLGKNVAAEVRVLPKDARDCDGAVISALSFGVGEVKDKLWTERGKHLAEGHPLAFSPRIIILHDHPAMAALKQKGVVEVLTPTVKLLNHVTDILESAKNETKEES